MHDRAAVAAAPQADTQPERQPARPNGVERLIALELARRPTPVRGLQRCGAGGCTCGGACGGRGHGEEIEDELRMGAQALQRAVAERRMVARDGQDPGPPQAPDMQGLGCGFNSKGEWTCTGETGKGPLEFDPKTLPSTKPPTLPGRVPASCPTERWNWATSTCCPEGQFFNETARKCATPGKEQPVPIKPFDVTPSGPLPPSSPAPFVVPPAPEPPPKGDFPLPSGAEMYA